MGEASLLAPGDSAARDPGSVAGRPPGAFGGLGGPSVRRDDWPERLSGVVTSYLGRSFSWGSCDCGTFFSDCVLAMTGADPLADVRAWKSADTALIRLRRAGFASVAELVQARFPQIKPAEAGRGDLVFLDGPAHHLTSPAVLTGAEAVSVSETGIVVVPRGLARWAFRV